VFKQYSGIRGLPNGVGNDLQNGNQTLKGGGRLQFGSLSGQGKLFFKGTKPSPVQDTGPRLEEKFCTFEIEHIQRNENRYADALAFSTVESISKSIIEIPKLRLTSGGNP